MAGGSSIGRKDILVIRQQRAAAQPQQVGRRRRLVATVLADHRPPLPVIIQYYDCCYQSVASSGQRAYCAAVPREEGPAGRGGVTPRLHANYLCGLSSPILSSLGAAVNLVPALIISQPHGFTLTNEPGHSPRRVDPLRRIRQKLIPEEIRPVDDTLRCDTGVFSQEEPLFRDFSSPQRPLPELCDFNLEIFSHNMVTLESFQNKTVKI